ncbi:MAG TPA: hypothetical protein VNY31_01215 [Solirubrobacteraceae bacterium]|nr:hypothetical protein [Solirubrobacteraceae bacterium]
MLGLLVLFGFSAVTAASAAAAEWWVGKSLLTGKEELSPKTNVTKSFTIKSAKLDVACSEISVKNGFIAQHNENTIESLVFEHCSVVGQSGCEVLPVATEPLAFPLEGEKENIRLNFLPKKGGTTLGVVTIKAKGTCTVTGSFKLTSGAKRGMICNYPGVEKEHAEHELVFNEASGSEIEINSEKATFTGEVFFKLTSGKEWSAK